MITNNASYVYFDIDEDWDLINFAFASELGIRLKQTQDDDMNYDEFLEYVYGLLSCDCAFARIVNIRSTSSEEAADLSADDMKIWVSWRQKHPECVTHTKKLKLEDLFGDEE